MRERQALEVEVDLSGFERASEVEGAVWPDPVRQAYLKPTWDLVLAYLGVTRAHDWLVVMLVAEWELSDGRGGSAIFFDALQAANEIENEARSARFSSCAKQLTIDGALQVMSDEEFAEAWGRFQ